MVYDGTLIAVGGRVARGGAGLHALVPPVGVAPPVHGVRRGIAGLILLAGAVRPTPFHSALGRSLLDLPVKQDYSLLQLWCDEVAGLARGLGMGRLSLRVLVDRHSPKPSAYTAPGNVRVTLEQDPSELRGTGGLMHDLTVDAGASDRVLVAASAQVLLEPLSRVVAALFEVGGDVALVAHEDGSPSSAILLQCRCLRDVPKVGFHDLKEQTLPLMAQKHDVRVMSTAAVLSMPIRSEADYIAALRRYHAPLEQAADAYAERWRPAFSIVEPGAQVHATARVHDSVVLAGARVDADAVVARCVVCAGGVVRRGRTVIDSLVK